MYQVKFNSSFPLDESEALVSRPVFHVPARSKYVFVAKLSRLRGSDASNVHDEEPAEYELEFSDDEAEAAHKAKLRNRCVCLFLLGFDVDIKHMGQAACLARTERTCITGPCTRSGLRCLIRLEPICRAWRV
jgi:hypothetical protein